LQKSYKTKELAERALRDGRISRKEHGHIAPLLSSFEAADFVLVRDRPKAAGATVQDAVDYYIKHAVAAREQG
jgi:hypothetical protein